ncbi:MAG: hypothetical protein A2X94_15230 [Bdellovibrionales bacterium GWB1_55_8]|nr:MAG: hypothetical protein A2X94_15230 [Bdellovibrionales bacterium GWB1_55_8]
MDVRNTPSAPEKPIVSSTTPIVSNPTPVGHEVFALEHSSISWKAIFAGTLLALLSYAVLMSLGLAIGGGQLQDVIRGENATGLGIGSGIWIALSVFVSLFIGGYFGGRVAGFITTRIGGVQGAVISALFFGFLLSQAASAVGFLGKGIGSTVGFVGGTIGDLATNPQVQQTVNEALQGETLNAPVTEVAQGLATRLIQGDTGGARDYLVQNSSLTNEQADRIISDVRAKVEPAAEKAAKAGAQAISAVGWTLFISLTLGTFFAVLGGGLGARARLKKPFTSSEVREVRKTRTAA